MPSHFLLTTRRSFSLAALVLLAAAAPASAQQSDPAAIELLKKVSQKFADVQRYAYASSVEVGRQNGEDPKIFIAKAKVKLAAAQDGRFFINVRSEDEKSEKSEYSAIFDGKKSWTFIPEPPQYAERTADSKLSKEAGRGEFPELDQATPERFAREFVPVVAKLAKTADVSFLRGTVLTVLSEKDSKGRQTLLYLTVDPATLVVSRATWVRSIESKGAKTLVRCDYVFSEFRQGESVVDKEFSFTPPAGAKRVDDLKLSGR